MHGRKLFVCLAFLGAKAMAGNTFHCENKNYTLEIDANAKTAEIAHKQKSGTSFKVEKFDKTGSKVDRYIVHGEAKALRYEGTENERWYEGEALIRTSAKLEGDEIVYSAQFLIDYDPYYTVTSWTGCEVR